MRYFSKSYWIFLLMSVFAGLFTYLIATTLWWHISGVNWFQFPDIGLLCVLPFVLVSIAVIPWIDFKKSSAFSKLYFSIAFVFAAMMFIFNDMSDSSISGWIILFVIGWFFVSLLPVLLLMGLARRWLCKSN